MEILKVFGLPAHPLVVHLPVILIPLAAISTLVVVFVPAARHSFFRWIALGLAAAALVGTQLAMGTGEVLAEHVRETDLVETHQHLAENMRVFTFVFFVALAAFVLYDWWSQRRTTPAADAPEPGSADPGGSTVPNKVVMGVLAGLTVLSAVVATTWVVRTGHSGAKATWEKVHLTSGEREGGEAGEGGG